MCIYIYASRVTKVGTHIHIYIYASRVQRGLKLETAPGPDQIQPEHIFYGGATLVTPMTALFNQIVEQEYIPQIFHHSLIIPTPKSSDKDPSDPSNYRGITLISLIAKIFEKVILLRLQAAGIPTLLTNHRLC